MPITSNGIETNIVTIPMLLAENAKLRRDIERMGQELATMKAANAELQARLSAMQEGKL